MLLQFCLQGCKDLFLTRSTISQNISLLAESGYAEGQMCHVLAVGGAADRRLVAVSAPMLVRPRRLLRNILVDHEGLEVLLQVLESAGKRKKEEEEEDGELVEEADDLFSHAVLSCGVLAAHVGVVAPNLKLEEDAEPGGCLFRQEEEEQEEEEEGDVVVFVLDDGSELPARRSLLSSASGVFGAMFGGSFAESSRRRVPLPGAGGRGGAALLLLHHLYGCRRCPRWEAAAPGPLLELVTLSDRFLLPELNRAAAREVVRRCLKVEQVVGVYERSLRGGQQGRTRLRQEQEQEEEEGLSACAVNYLLVGAMSHSRRVQLFDQLLRSRMAADFADDVGRVLRRRLADAR